MTEQMPYVVMWEGRRVSELGRDELLKVIEWMAADLRRVAADRDRWRDSGDAAGYLFRREWSEQTRRALNR